jgi:hypothetical protein|tara:strand:+ start:139 stop:828 length:690 start_codon:yes stop_codon:yes gene_type:complete
MSNGNYTWEEVMLGIDSGVEAERKRGQAEDIETKQQKEANAMSAWSLGLSILGAAIFGPVGYMVGKELGQRGADKYYDWESMTVDVGKFNTEESKRYNRVMDKTAKSQTLAQAIGTVTNLATMYVQAGGLKGGDIDLTTFGTGGAEGGEWSFLGKGPKTLEFGGFVPEAEGMVNPDRVPSFFDEGGYHPIQKLSDLGSTLIPGKKKSSSKGKDSTVSPLSSKISSITSP